MSCTDIVIWNEPIDICAICLDDINDYDNKKILTCDHVFHDKCADKLYHRQFKCLCKTENANKLCISCPLCRKKQPIDDYFYFSLPYHSCCVRSNIEKLMNGMADVAYCN